MAWALAAGGVALGTGGCLPENFWADLAGGSVATGFDTAIGIIVARMLGA
jgi:hypothetical protein